MYVHKYMKDADKYEPIVKHLESYAHPNNS